MLRKNPSGQSPNVSEGAFIDATALICGHVIIEDNVFVGPYAVIRADEEDRQGNVAPITIKEGANVQDGVVIHALAGTEVVIGSCSSIAHRAIVHGPCIIGENVFIGFNSVIFRTNIADNCVIRHNCVVDNVDLVDAVHVPPLTNIEPGYDLKKLPELTLEYQRFSAAVVTANHLLVKGYKELEDESI
jgi:carbonic anhydrase/acetyltransferase-like protein (isoleucine patch superfamily)